MKTPENILHKLQACVAVPIILLMLSACQKDNTMQPEPAAASAYSGEKVVPVNPVAPVYEMLKINHIAGRSILLPDYEVTVNSDLSVIFVGRRNTATLGKAAFTIEEKIFLSLKDMFESSHLFVPTANDANNIPHADLPYVLTSFSNGNFTVTLTDDGMGTNRQLYALRLKAEEMLHISVLVYGDRAP
ncbi:MAG: DUF6438 domain-containing protein [Bacteroidia bacterium]